MRYDILDILLVQATSLFLLMTPHDNSSHDEKPDVDKDDHHDWNYEGPHKTSAWIKETAARGVRSSY